MKKLFFIICLHASINVFSQAGSFMYHIDCYLNKDTIPTFFFANIRSFGLFNTDMDGSVSHTLVSWKLTVEASDGKKVSFNSKSDNPNALTPEMRAAMEGKAGMLPAKITFGTIKIAKTKKTGGTTFLDGGSAVFFRGQSNKECK